MDGKKAVFLDIDNTLLDFDACSEEAIRLGFAERGLPWEHGLYAVFRRVNDGLWQQLERGEITREELHAVRFDRVLAAMGVQADGAEFEREFRRRLYDLAIPMAHAEALLRALGGRYRLFAASNGAHGQQLNRLQNAALLPYFEEVFTSQRMGWDKPSREFFDGCFRLLPGLGVEECVMVGDSLTADIAGALRYGMDAIFFNPHALPLPEELAAAQNAATLEEVARLLGV